MARGAWGHCRDYTRGFVSGAAAWCALGAAGMDVGMQRREQRISKVVDVGAVDASVRSRAGSPLAVTTTQEGEQYSKAGMPVDGAMVRRWKPYGEEWRSQAMVRWRATSCRLRVPERGTWTVASGMWEDCKRLWEECRRRTSSG